ncbi:gamma-aminobutyric acid type B receptor subunit 2-like [Amphiura filiformis]|uniref:gamma-aminobutyric acid type B receptor subunit 2-like n=1 Tax=Amphiura filiformis TaxID=82378 RepID=UPI003B21B3EA
MFGSMFSKTWRVYRLAGFKIQRNVALTDKHLILMVFAFFGIDVVVLILWQILDPMYVKETEIYDDHIHETKVSELIQSYIDECTSNHFTYWIISLYVYKGLLLIFGTFLAWETRKVTIPALNDSKMIGICVYNTVVLCILGVSVSYQITNDPQTLFIFTSSIIILCVTAPLLLLFVPKVIVVYNYPHGVPSNGVKRCEDLGIRSERRPNDVNTSDI